jgi:hypothetical protein
MTALDEDAYSGPRRTPVALQILIGIAIVDVQISNSRTFTYQCIYMHLQIHPEPVSK